MDTTKTQARLSATPAEYVGAVLTVKAWLRKYRECIQDIYICDERVKRITNRLESVSSPKLTDMPRSPSPATDRITDMIAQRDRLVEASAKQRAFVQKTQAIIDKVLSVCAARERSIIKLYDLDGMEFGDIIPIVLAKEIQDGMKYSQCQSYVYRYRRKAILKIARTLQDSDGSIYPKLDEVVDMMR